MAGPYWDDQCPKRGPALKHVHWNSCDPKGYHPGSSDKHQIDQCCHCGLFLNLKPVPRSVAAGPEPHACVFNAVGVCSICGTYHSFKWTITGSCATCGQRENICRARQADHVDLREREQQLVEPKAITGMGPAGPRWERGRWWDQPGELSGLDKNRMEFYAIYLIERGLRQEQP